MCYLSGQQCCENVDHLLTKFYYMLTRNLKFKYGPNTKNVAFLLNLDIDERYSTPANYKFKFAVIKIIDDNDTENLKNEIERTFFGKIVFQSLLIRYIFQNYFCSEAT